MRERQNLSQNLNEKQELRETVPALDEIETKIINLGSKAEFEAKLSDMGAKLVHEKRLITDTQFRLLDDLPKELSSSVTYQFHNSSHPAEMKAALEYLGLEILEVEDPNIIACRVKKEFKKRTVRLREEGGKILFTVKQMRKGKSKVDKRMEHEIEIDRPDIVRIMLKDLGYKETSFRQKERTTYKLTQKSTNGKKDFKIDIDESPLKQVPAWAEIEGPSPEDVTNLTFQLGFTGEDIGGISTTDYYELKGVNREQSKNIQFKN